MYKVPFFRPNLRALDADALGRALKGERETLLGEFEKKAAKYLGAQYAIAAVNPASAIHLALCALDIKRGDKIVCSANTHPALPEMIRHFDAEPIFVDIDTASFNMNLDALEKILDENRSKKLRGILISFVAGQTPNLEKLYQIAKQHGAFVLEEACGAFGLSYKNRRVGTLEADITILSFSPIDAPASANTGLILTSEAALKDRAALLRNHGIDRSQNSGVEYTYDVLDIGCDYLPSALDLACAISELNKADALLSRRVAIAAAYDKAFADVPHITAPVKSADHAYGAYVIKVDKNRDGFAKSLAQRGVQTGLHYIPLHMMSYYRAKYGLRITSFPGALNNYQQILSLPIYADMSDGEVGEVIAAVSDIARARTW